MKLPVVIVVFGAMLVFCFSVDADDTDIDPKEIRSTQIAETLLTHGFQEVPKDSGIYKKGKVPLAVLLKDFDLALVQLKPVPSVSKDEWMRSTKISGNHTVLEAPKPVTDNSLVNISVNLGYVRPKHVRVGMTVSRTDAALQHLGARNVFRDVAVTKTDASKRTASYLLPDNTALVLMAIRSQTRKPMKPKSPTITQLVVSEKGKGRDHWDKQKRTSVKTFPIQTYRTSKK